MSVDDIPVAHTPTGGYGDELPPPILAGCVEPLVDGAPDLRGQWRVVAVDVKGKSAPDDHPAFGVVQRIEQCGDRVVISASGVIHDMRCDGSEANGVHDVMQSDFETPITVVASYEDGRHMLRPTGMPPEVSVTRALDGSQMVWDYAGLFTARCDRIGE
jgi:hypothetical protein